MGRCDYSIVGAGMTEQEAHRDAVRKDRDEHGHEEGYNGGISSSTHEDDKSKCIQKPVRSKTCNVAKKVQQGARKWETVFVIAPCWGFSDNNYNPNKHITVNTTQGDALKKAKAMALEFGEEFSIDIEKRLSSGTSRIATIAPKKSQIGKWQFTGTARC